MKFAALFLGGFGLCSFAFWLGGHDFASRGCDAVNWLTSSSLAGLISGGSLSAFEM